MFCHPSTLQTHPDHFNQVLSYTTDMVKDWKSNFEVSTAIGQFEAVLAGVGIGILHDFMVQRHPDLHRLFSQRSINRSYWMVWHENLPAVRRIQASDLIQTLVSKEHDVFVAPTKSRSRDP